MPAFFTDIVKRGTALTWVLHLYLVLLQVPLTCQCRLSIVPAFLYPLSFWIALWSNFLCVMQFDSHLYYQDLNQYLLPQHALVCPEMSVTRCLCFYPAASLDKGNVSSPSTSRLVYIAHSLGTKQHFFKKIE